MASVETMALASLHRQLLARRAVAPWPLTSRR
jgi:hypothetical protein